MAEGSNWDLISSYAGLLSLATLSIYAGSVGSIPTSKSRKPGASSADVSKDDDEEEEEEDITDRLSSEDAWLFPVIGSFALFGMYLVVKYLGKEWINFLLGWYFAITGVASVWKSSISLLRTILGPKLWSSFDKVHFTLHKGIFTKSSKPNLFSISLRTPSLVLLPFAVLPSILYQTLSWGRKSALLTNILGLSFSHNALSLLKLDSFKTGTILLSGLFIYDIWWVFGTEVMVKVATNLDLPIKILWPKSAVFDSSKGYTMLGLGDIVIPGTFIALALRYDYYRHTIATKSTPEATSTAYAKPYFTAGLIAYVSGLVTTMTVMHVFKAAQPALLYLSPACILSFLGTAAVRGELGEAWKWADDPAKEKEDAKKKEEDKKKKTGEESALLDQTQEGAGTGGYGAVMKGAAGESRENVADE